LAGLGLLLLFYPADLGADGFVLAVLNAPGDGAGESFGEETARAFLAGGQAAAVFLPRGALEELAFALDYPENTALLYLDAGAPPGEIVIYHGARGGVSPLALARPLAEAFEKHGVPYRFGVRAHELYNLGLVEGPAALEQARALEIPAIMIAGVSDGEREPITAEALGAVLADYAAAVHWEPGGLDRHYTLFAYGEHIFFLTERATILLILMLAGAGIALTLARPAPRRRSEPDAGQGTGGPRLRADTCARGAVALAILGILIGAFMDLSCAPAFIWSLAFAILGAALRFTPAVFTCALLSPFKGAETVVQTLREGGVTGSALFLHPGIYPLLTLLLLPCLFLALRGIMLINEGRKGGLKVPADFEEERAVKEEEVPHGGGE
jgi:hypothetical protein